MKRLSAVAIEEFKPLDDGAVVVSVVVVGPDKWYVAKAAELIESSPKLYAAVCAASQWLHQSSHGDDPEFDALLLQLREAEAAAKGATVRRAKP